MPLMQPLYELERQRCAENSVRGYAARVLNALHVLVAAALSGEVQLLGLAVMQLNPKCGLSNPHFASVPCAMNDASIPIRTTMKNNPNENLLQIYFLLFLG
jgi:hypothetical protein